MLVHDPTAGAVIAGTGGLRKLRHAIGGKGKSGGVRIIYLQRHLKGRMYLVTVYAKNQKDDLTRAERNQMKKLAAVLNAEP